MKHRLARLAAAGLLVCLAAPAAPRVFAAFAELPDGGMFYPFTVDEDRLAGAPDQSALNHPLGPADRLFVKHHHFYAVGPDGLPDTADDVRVRLFGANLSFGANFPAESGARAAARRLRKLGFNAVRLHHLDFHLSDAPDAAPQGVLTTGPYPSFNPVAIRRLRAFIQALSQEGIYIDLNLHVSYRFRPDVDGVPPVAGADPRAEVGVPIGVYYPALIEKQKRYARGLIEALGLGDSPALALVEINNESSLLDAWQSDVWHGENWPKAIPPGYGEVLQAQWRRWVVRRYGSVADACAAWRRCADPDVLALPKTTLYGTGAAGPTTAQRWMARLDRVTRHIPWLDGGPDVEDPQRAYDLDFLQFLIDTDRAYFDQMKAVVREATQGAVPVTGTQMGYGGVLNFDAQAEMDYIDNHLYVSHPVYAGSGPWQSTDWRVPDVSASGAGLERILGLALRRDADKPFVVSEFNQPFPSPSGSEITPILAAVAAQQDWDGLFFYDYDDDAQPKQSPASFALSGNWGQYALVGQSARIFRQPLVPALQPRVLLPLSRAQRNALALQGNIDTQTLERWLRKTHGVDVDAVLRVQLAEDVLSAQRPEAGQALSGAPMQAASSAPGALRRDAQAQRLVLDAPDVWGVFGPLTPGAVVSGPDFGVRLQARQAQPVQLLVTPLDHVALRASRHFLVSLGGFTTGTQPGSAPPRPQRVVPYPGKPGWLTLEPDPRHPGPTGWRDTRAPAWMQRLDVSLAVPHPAAGLAVYALDGAGQRRIRLPDSAITPDADGRRVWVRLQGALEYASPWYEVVLS
ncbi:hypothetical protein [Castellaniella caeni]|uniref:hypothetical protein n=1 Tax=Castellaniella caeni TaxID=266123 RepID=UPI0008341697|nr:hypothetical protein [Castellaniella caeni]